MPRRLQSTVLVLGLVLAPGRASGVELELARPDLAALEPAVAEQLATLAQAVDERRGAGAAGAELAEPVGELARHYHAYGLAGPAEAAYAAAEELDGGDFRWPYHLGYLLQQEGRLEEAADAYQRALLIVPEVPPALVRLAQVYSELGRARAAEPLLDRALKLDPTSAAALAALGELHLAAGRYREAVELLERALEYVPDADRLHYPLGQAYRQLGDAEAARQALARAGTVGIKPADPLIDGLEELKTGERAFVLQGRAAFGAGRWREAADAFRRAVEANPESIPARVNLGAALARLGETEAAIAEYRRVVELAPANGTALYNLGVLLSEAGDLPGALEALREGALYNPEDPELRYRLADALRRSDELEKALVHYRAAIEMDPALEGARLGEADVLSSQGRLTEARDRLAEGVELLPTSGALAQALSRLLAMGPDLALRDGARALDLAERVYRARPTAENAAVVAAALAELGRCAEAAEWQARAAEGLVSVSLDQAARARIWLDRYRAGAPCARPGS